MSAVHFALLALMLTSVGSAQTTVELRADLTDASRHLLHVTECLPVHPGVNTFSYPQWIPGQHLPGGPIDNLTGLVFHAASADGPVLPWRRDLVDLYSFHVTVPAGTSSLMVAFDILEVPSRANTTGTNMTSSHVVMLEPSDIVLYPSNVSAREITVLPTVHLPHGWTVATALRTPEDGASAGPDITYRPVSLEQFVDSPLLAGDHCRQYPLAPEIRPAHMLDICADKSADLELQPALLADMNALVRQAKLLFRSRHYDHYDFLVALSPHLEGDSLEHAQSADYMVKSLDMADPNTARLISYLLPHEYTHSWCGKYRRPAGMATPEYHTPQQDDLLWVYEGLTEYYGDVLAARAGFRAPSQVIDAFHRAAWDVDQPGRNWRPLQDTADAAPILRGSDPAWSSWRLGQNFYHEGALVWLEADVVIRRLSRGTKSLDDFASLFLGSTPSGTIGDTGPAVLTYTFPDVVRALNQTAPYDWEGFWTGHLNQLTGKPPTVGLEEAGYSYRDSGTMMPDEAAALKGLHIADMLHSLGFVALPDGTLRDISMSSPAFKAGLGPGDKLTAVNGAPYSAEVLTKAVDDAERGGPAITLTALRDDESTEYRIDYHEGEKYAVLKRNANPDILTTAILAPRK